MEIPKEGTPEFETMFGGYNDAPPNFKEITEADFASSKFFVYSPVEQDFRQIIMKGLDGREVYTDIRLYIFHDGTGVGIVADQHAGKVRYFQFGVCEHKYRELSAAESRKKGVEHWGMCWHVYQCDKCGDMTSADSSD